MAVYLPNGSTISIASAYSSSTNITAISNATDAVASVVSATGIVVGNIVEVTSGWSRLTGRLARVSVVSTNDLTLEDINTTSTTRYPALGGTGSLREVTTFTQISQILSSTTQGGEQQFTNYAFLEDGFERQIPTNKSAQSITLSIADDPLLAHYALLDAADDDRLPRAIKVTLASGAVIYYNCYVTLNKTPTLTINEVSALEVTLSFVAEQTRYAS